jgi:hypothetical protein
VAFLAAGITQHHVMRAAGAGGFLLGMTGATVPHTLSERRHERSFPERRLRAERGAPRFASRVPLVGMNGDADFSRTAPTPRELSYRFRG